MQGGKKRCQPWRNSLPLLKDNPEARWPTIRVICFGFFLQKLTIGVSLMTLVSEHKRQGYDEIVEVYPLTEEGDETYSRHVLIYIVQLLGGFVLLISAFCMMKKNPSTMAPHLLPWFLTASLLSELPVRPVLPESIRISIAIIAPLLIFAVLGSMGNHVVVNTFCMGLASTYLAYQGAGYFDKWLLAPNSALLLALAFLQIIFVVEMSRRNQLALVRQISQVNREKDDYKTILGNLPDGVIIARRKDQRETQQELDQLVNHLDDQLSVQRYVQPFEVKFCNHYALKLLKEAQKYEDRSHVERSTLNILNKEEKDKKGGGEENDWTFQTYDSKLGLKIFSFVVSDDPASKLMSSVVGQGQGQGYELSISDILNEESWKGRRVYKLRVQKRQTQSLRSLSSLNTGSYQPEATTSSFFELDLQTNAFCNETVQILTLRNINKQSTQDSDGQVYNQWANMLSKLFVRPTQEILKVTGKHRSIGGVNSEGDKNQSKDSRAQPSSQQEVDQLLNRRLYNDKSHEANLYQPMIIPLASVNQDQGGSYSSPFESIWRQSKILEYTTSSIIKRLRYSSPNPSLVMTMRTPQEVDKTIENSFRVLERQLQDKMMTYRIQIHSKNVHKLLAEWELYEMVVYQLVNNAIKFSNVGGCITVSVLFLRSQEQFLLRTSVIDSGSGIFVGKLEGISQALSEKSELALCPKPQEQQGKHVLGFGLTTAKNFVHLLGGQLQLNSLPWFKTEATFSMPIKLQPLRQSDITSKAASASTASPTNPSSPFACTSSPTKPSQAQVAGERPISTSCPLKLSKQSIDGKEDFKPSQLLRKALTRSSKDLTGVLNHTAGRDEEDKEMLAGSSGEIVQLPSKPPQLSTKQQPPPFITALNDVIIEMKDGSDQMSKPCTLAAGATPFNKTSSKSSPQAHAGEGEFTFDSSMRASPTFMQNQDQSQEIGLIEGLKHQN